MASYYALAPDRVSTVPIAGGIEITKEQWQAAIDVLTDPNDPRVIHTAGGEFALALPIAAPVYAPDPPSVDQLKARAADCRRARVYGGRTITVGARQFSVWTDPESTSAITSLVVAAQITPALTTTWKGRAGAVYSVDAAEILALALGMLAHVQEAFGAEAAVLADIAAGTITTTAEIDAAAWPPNT